MQTSSSSPCARHVVRCCHAAGFEPNVSFESDDYQTVQGLVAAGVGVALIPELALSVVREDIVVRALVPRAARAPGDRRHACRRAAGAGRRQRCSGSSRALAAETASWQLKAPGRPASCGAPRGAHCY